MGREIRRVPPLWSHPFGQDGHYKPLLEPEKPIEELQAEWDRDNVLWLAGEHPDQRDPRWSAMVEGKEYEEWNGARPRAEDFMPFWPEAERTLIQMYEDTSEGTPISPAFATPEELARWLADNDASSFAGMTATYDEWLAVCRRGSSIGSCIVNAETGEMISGVSAAARKP